MIIVLSLQTEHAPLIAEAFEKSRPVAYLPRVTGGIFELICARALVSD